MMDIILFILGFGVVSLFIYWLMKKVQTGDDLEGNFVSSAQIAKRREAMEKIVILAGQTSRITNADVQKHLGIPEAAANRYLEYLVKLNKLTAINERGQAIYYQLPPKY